MGRTQITWIESSKGLFTESMPRRSDKLHGSADNTVLFNWKTCISRNPTIRCRDLHFSWIFGIQVRIKRSQESRWRYLNLIINQILLWYIRTWSDLLASPSKSVKVNIGSPHFTSESGPKYDQICISWWQFESWRYAMPIPGIGRQKTSSDVWPFPVLRPTELSQTVTTPSFSLFHCSPSHSPNKESPYQVLVWTRTLPSPSL